MPTPQQILDGLREIATTGVPLAAAWHVAIMAVVVALLTGWRPKTSTLGTLLALPFASVAVLAMAFGNPFNGTTFALLTALLIAIARRLASEPIRPGPAWAMTAGVVMVLFGWTYPHFLSEWPWGTHLVAAPTGLLPCPTLSLVVGATLMAGGLSRAWGLVLAGFGAFYGALGALRLGVEIDLVLLGGSLALAVLVVRPPRSAAEPERLSENEGH